MTTRRRLDTWLALTVIGVVLLYGIVVIGAELWRRL
jgi:hypothetical protein